MFCPKCGKEIMDEAVICPHCGCATGKNSTGVSSGDSPSTGYAVLGFFFPLIGLILYLVNKDTYPSRAKSAGKGALIGFIVSIVVSILYGVIAGAALASMY